MGSDTHIHDNHPAPNVPGEDVDGRPAAQEIGYHLGGDFLGIGADAFSHNTVVAGHNEDDFVLDLGLWIAGDACQLNGQRLDSSQTTLRLGQYILASLCCRHSGFVQWANPRNQILE